MNRLAGKLALITGGNSGIGLATAQAFVAEGARVAITGRDPETLEAAQKSLGEGHVAIRSDASDVKAIHALFATVKQHAGALEALSRNAAVRNGGTREPRTDADHARILGVNVRVVLYAIKRALPFWRRGPPMFLKAPIAPPTGRAGLSLYAASKAAVR